MYIPEVPCKAVPDVSKVKVNIDQKNNVPIEELFVTS